MSQILRPETSPSLFQGSASMWQLQLWPPGPGTQCSPWHNMQRLALCLFVLLNESQMPPTTATTTTTPLSNTPGDGSQPETTLGLLTARPLYPSLSLALSLALSHSPSFIFSCILCLFSPSSFSFQLSLSQVPKKKERTTTLYTTLAVHNFFWFRSRLDGWRCCVFLGLHAGSVASHAGLTRGKLLIWRLRSGALRSLPLTPTLGQRRRAYARLD